MDRRTEETEIEVIELGTASLETKGANGFPLEIGLNQPNLGLSD